MDAKLEKKIAFVLKLFMGFYTNNRKERLNVCPALGLMCSRLHGKQASGFLKGTSTYSKAWHIVGTQKLLNEH